MNKYTLLLMTIFFFLIFLFRILDLNIFISRFWPSKLSFPNEPRGYETGATCFEAVTIFTLPVLFFHPSQSHSCCVPCT